MTDEKLNGIIKALKLCTGIETACKDCPYRASVSPSFSVRCEDTLHKASLEAIETLKAENAALYERLDKVIEPPCKIGDTVYKIVSCCYDCKDDWGDGCRCENLHKSKIVALKVNSIRFDEDGYVLSEDTAGSAGSLSLYCYESNFGKDWFLTPRSRRNTAERTAKENGNET